MFTCQATNRVIFMAKFCSFKIAPRPSTCLRFNFELRQKINVTARETERWANMWVALWQRARKPKVFAFSRIRQVCARETRLRSFFEICEDFFASTTTGKSFFRRDNGPRWAPNKTTIKSLDQRPIVIAFTTRS